MKLSVLALDYDGTIATNGHVDADVRQAIAEARTSGITVLLVTGRILSELRRVAGDLHFVDGVIAENGAVVHFPDSDHTSVLAPRLAEPLVKALEREGVAFQPGESLIDADAADAQRLLSVIRRLELPYVLVFNRGRVMILPQGVSKATGLQAALQMWLSDVIEVRNLEVTADDVRLTIDIAYRVLESGTETSATFTRTT